MSPLERLVEYLGERFSPHTRRAYIAQAQRFLTFCGVKPSYSREEILAYMDHLIHENYRAESIHTMLSGVRALFYVEGIAWPLTPRDMRLGLPQNDPCTPTLSAQEVAQMIQGCRNTPGFPRAVVALTTTFGLRGDELVRVFGAGCNGRVLEVQTAKGGRKRRHSIPVVLQSVLTIPPTRVSARGLHDLFERQMLTSVREPAPREGWHAVRRAVVTGLLSSGLSPFQVHHWMGWRESREISYRYFHPELEDLDREVFRHHPFLPYWRGMIHGQPG